MSGRDTVRSFREGAISAKATAGGRSTGGGGNLTKAIATIVGAAVIAFVGVTLVMNYVAAGLIPGVPGALSANIPGFGDIAPTFTPPPGVRYEALEPSADIPTFGDLQKNLRDKKNGKTAALPEPPASSDSATLANGIKAFSPADAQACSRLAAAVKARERQERDAAEARTGNPFGSSGGGVANLGPDAAQLTCEAETRPLRFCDSGQRAAFVSSTLRYIDQYMQLTTTMRRAQASLEADPSQLHLMPGQVGMPEVLKSGLAGAETINRGVAATLRDLAQKGLIAESDFGGFLGMGVPAAIHEMLAGVAVSSQSCA